MDSFCEHKWVEKERPIIDPVMGKCLEMYSECVLCRKEGVSIYDGSKKIAIAVVILPLIVLLIFFIDVMFIRGPGGAAS